MNSMLVVSTGLIATKTLAGASVFQSSGSKTESSSVLKTLSSVCGSTQFCSAWLRASKAIAFFMGFMLSTALSFSRAVRMTCWKTYGRKPYNRGNELIVFLT